MQRVLCWSQSLCGGHHWLHTLRRDCSSASRRAGWGELLPLRRSVLAALCRQQLDEPLAIQRAATPRILSGESVAVHAQTGSGKTLAYLLPILARCRQRVPRQVLVLVPSHQLALQTLEVSEDLMGPSDEPIAELLASAKPAQREQALMQQQAPFLIMTSGQLASSDVATLERLRASLHAVVVDEPDMVLAPAPGKAGLRRRSRRNQWLLAEPTALALQRVLERRRGTVEHSRVQLVLLSATITKMRLRDIQTVVLKRAGRIGLVVAPSHPSDQFGASTPPSRIDSFRCHSESTDPSAEPLRQPSEVSKASVQSSEHSAELPSEQPSEQPSVQPSVQPSEQPLEEERVAAPNGPRDGFGVRGGVLRVPMPTGLRHLVALTPEEDKATAVRELMTRLRPKLALLVVRDGLEPGQVKTCPVASHLTRCFTLDPLPLVHHRLFSLALHLTTACARRVGGS